MKLKLTARAQKDLLNIFNFIAKDNPKIARDHINQVLKKTRQACRFPRSGRMMPELGDPLIREFVMDNYRIIYRIKKRVIQIITVFEGHKLFKEELS